MNEVFLEMDQATHRALVRHLLPPEPKAEEAAFLYAACHSSGSKQILRTITWDAIGPKSFVQRSLYGMELRDAARGRMIKHAHDLEAVVVEFHSHPFAGPAEFSPSDRAGLAELVPHVRWRLRGRPYAAVVVAPGSFDALVWQGDLHSPKTLDGMLVGKQCFRPTGLSQRFWEESDG